MYTNCPECGTVFRISTNELRLAEGVVRCGHCAATFNALETLTDELPPTITLKQLTLPTAPAPGAATDEPSPSSEDTLEFDIPEERWSNFFEPNGPDKEAATPTAGDNDGDAHGDSGSDTVEQAGPILALAAEEADRRLADDGDWQALLEEVQDVEVSPDPVYVIGEEPRPTAADKPVATPPPAPLPADFAADLTGVSSAAVKPEAWQGADPGLRADDRPFLWKPPTPPAAVRSGRHRAYSAGSVLLALLLVIQVLHQQRDELATNPALTEPLRRTYAALGLPLWPAWDLKAYELRNSEAVADRTSPGALDILARIAVVGNKPVGLPLVRVTLRDRLSRPLGSRVFQPDEYIRATAAPRKLVGPGTLIPIEISLKDPGADAQGFDVDVCVMNRRAGVVCRVDREPFRR